MQEVNQRRLRYFYNVVVSGSIRGAAEVLNTAPSVITRQLRLLEQELGVKLFERDVSGSKPTEAAQFLLDYWHSSRVLIEILEERIEETQELKRGRVFVALSEGFLDDFVDNVLMRFNRDFPKIELAVNVLSVGEIVEQVASDIVHIGIIFNPPNTPHIKPFLHANVPIRLFASTEHPLAKSKGPVTVAEALRYPIATMPHIFGLGRLTELLAESERTSANVVFTSNSARSIAHFIRNGTAVSFLGSRHVVAEFGDTALAAIEVKHPLLEGNYANVVARAERTPTKAMSTLIDYIARYSEIFGAP